MFTNAALVLFVAPSTGDNCHGSQRAGGQVSGTPGQRDRTGDLSCPGFCRWQVCEWNLGFHKKFSFLEDTIMGVV